MTATFIHISKQIIKADDTVLITILFMTKCAQILWLYSCKDDMKVMKLAHSSNLSQILWDKGTENQP